MFIYNIIKDFGALISLIVGGVFALYQYYRTKKLQSVTYLHDMVERMRSDTEVRGMIQKLEYGVFRFGCAFQGSEVEVTLDKTLEYLSFFCFMREERIITSKEFSFVEYEITHILMNVEVLKYLQFLYQFSCNSVFNIEPCPKKIVNVPFKYLIKYGQKKGLINDSFFEPSYLLLNQDTTANSV